MQLQAEERILTEKTEGLPTASNPVAHLLGSLPDFHLPTRLEAGEPPEARGLRRDQVRLMVSHYRQGALAHTQFCHLGEFLNPGDLLVVNNSGTRNAALPAIGTGGACRELHLSTELPAGLWVVELRSPVSSGTKPYWQAQPGETYHLPAGGLVQLLAPYRPEQRFRAAGDQPDVRLWIGSIQLPAHLDVYLSQYGFPIRYPYVREAWPNSYYQTVFATEVGSAEMPSAGRAFTPELVTALVASGIQIAPLTLHTGVASLESHEPPYEEYFRVPPATASSVNQALLEGRRVIAVGTTVVRALESAVERGGLVQPAQGWTDKVITPNQKLRAVTGLLTGFHEPRSSHLAMLIALGGRRHLQQTYQAALEAGYLWHEFGDLHLILP